MKKITTILLSLAILTACSSANEENLQGKLQVNTAPTQKVKNTSLENSFVPAPQNNQTLDLQSAQDQLDQDFIYQAAKTLDSKLCETVENTTLQNDCYSLVQDYTNLDSAIKNQNSSTCSKISDKNVQKRCEISLDKITAQEKQNQDFQSELDRLSDLLAKQDVSVCKQLNDANVREICQISIYLDLTHEHQDTKYCDNIQDKDAQTFCKALY